MINNRKHNEPSAFIHFSQTHPSAKPAHSNLYPQ